MRTNIECRAAVYRANTLMIFLIHLCPRTPNMLVILFSRIGAVEVNGILCTFDLLPEAVGCHNKVLFLAVDKEAQCMLQLTFGIEVVERFGVKDDSIIGIVLPIDRLIEVAVKLLTVLTKQNAPPLGVALFIGLLIEVVVNRHYGANPEVGDTEGEIVLVVLHGGAVTIVLIFQLIIGILALHDPLKCVQTEHRDGAVNVGCNGDRA